MKFRDPKTHKVVVSISDDKLQMSTGKLDNYGDEIFVGDLIEIQNANNNTNPDYWRPVYEVTWNGFSFGFKWVKGGKSIDSVRFNFEHYSVKTIKIVK